MRMTKLGAVLASLAVTAGTAAVLGASPAQAATATRAKLDLSGHHKVTATYKDYVGLFGGGVTYTQTDGSTAEVNAGDAVLQRKLPGKAWKNVRADDSAGFLYYGSYGSHATGNTQYRVHYLGGTDGTNTWDATYSNTVTVRTRWDLHENGTCSGGCHFFGKLGPKAKHHKVLIQVKHGSWKKYKVVRTNRKSKWSAKVVATPGRGTYYRAVVGKTKHEIKTTSATYRFYKF